MKPFHFASLLALFSCAACADDKSNPSPLKPCTIRSASTSSFFDLSTLELKPPAKGSDKLVKGQSDVSWASRGYDYGSNFTVNICGPVVERDLEFEGVKDSLAQNVSAYYTKDKKHYSIGSLNTDLVLRGTKLVLNYTNGSPCGSSHKRRAIKDDDDEKKDSTRTKSTIISMLCDRETIDPKGPKLYLAFVGTDEDECTYFFEGRSFAACAGIETTPQQLGPGGVFGVILLIAMLVYLVGGCVYQRTVMNQRGWKQLPNYSLWSGLFGFISDMVIILTSSCTRLIGRRGYSPVSLNGNSRGRGYSPESENRLIDELDEDWDD